MSGSYMPSYDMPQPDMGGMYGGGAPMMGGWDPTGASMMQPGGFAPSMDFMGSGAYGGAFANPYMMQGPGGMGGDPSTGFPGAPMGMPQ